MKILPAIFSVLLLLSAMAPSAFAAPADFGRVEKPALEQLRLVAYSVDAKHPDQPATFQICYIWKIAGRKTEFLKIGDSVARTNFQLTKFDPASDRLTVTDTVTNDAVVLTLPPQPRVTGH